MISIRQSTIKAFKKEDACPRKINETNITRSVESSPTASMMKGKIFESMCFDRDINNTSDMIPRLKNGNISVDYHRIIQQAKFFKEEFIKNYKLKINDSNLKLDVKYNEEITLVGELDIVGEILDTSYSEKPILAIMDMKLTGNLHSQFGDFSWALPAAMDHTQAVMYTYLYKEVFGPKLPFYYLVFDYKPKPEYKVIKKLVEQTDLDILFADIEKTAEKIKHYNKVGWEERPSFDVCKNCPLKDNCKSFANRTQIEVI
jgi:hypothetical protein